MRWLVPAFAAFAALAFSQAATAGPVSVAEVHFAPSFQTTLTRRLGDEEGPVLQEMVAHALAQALQRAGAEVTTDASVHVETTILDADPNLPTMKQLEDRPGLSMINSVSIGGARLSAVIRAADGHVLAEVSHSYHTGSLSDVVLPSDEWADARRAIRQFAEKVADAYVANVR